MPFIAKGTYGCVFKPHIVCENKRNIKDSVGKVFEFQEAMLSEMEFLQLLKEIDPEGEFTLSMNGSCTTKASFRKTDHTELCQFMRPGESYQQLIMPYGGKSVKHFLTQHSGSFAAFTKMVHRVLPIMRGLRTLQEKHGYIHQDIKPDNVLLHKNKLYLIDFSLMTKVDEVYGGKNEGVLAAAYPYFPPEYKLLVHPSTSLQRFLTLAKANYNFKASLGQADTSFLDLFTIVGIDIEKDLAQLHPQRRRLKAKTNAIASKVDIFSLGILLALIFKWCGLDTYVSKRKSNKSMFVDEAKAWIAGMLCIDPIKRSSLDQAIQECETLIHEYL